MKSNDAYSLQFASMKNNLKLKIISIITKDFSNDYEDTSSSLSNTINKIAENIIFNLEKWINDDLPQKYKKTVFDTIEKENWYEIINAFYQELNFGTSGMRGKLTGSLQETDSKQDLHLLQKNKSDSAILRGPNLFNEITLMKNIYGLVNYMKKNKLSKIIIGYDSRVQSKYFAELVTTIFLKYNFSVFLFDDVVPIPELSFAVTSLNADMGIEITASHNDKRYNGYKLITKTGSPPSIKIRNEISTEIFKNSQNVEFDILNANNNLLSENLENLVYLGGEQIRTKTTKSPFIDFHKKHLEQLQNMIFQSNLITEYAPSIKIGYSPIHGTGYNLASKLLSELGFVEIKYISQTTSPNPFFPSFDVTQMLDPSDNSTAKIIVKEFVNQYGIHEFENLDFLCFTDPDADRLGIIVNVPKDEESIYGKWKLLKANDVWTLFLWYMLEIIPKSNLSFSSNLSKMFVVKNFVTTDALTYLSQKYGIDCKDGKVGFSDLTTIVQKSWEEGKINIGMFEESCGFGMAGNPTYPELKSHILEKDGILTLALLVEIVAYAKSVNSTILQLLDNIYLDPKVGFFATFRTELPENGIYEGIKGELHQQRILKFVEELYDKAEKKSETDDPLKIAGLPILNIKKYSTGRYDEKYWKNFPDEGIRFFLDSKDNHITVRSSGTEPKIRIFVQYKMTEITTQNLLEKKMHGENLVKEIAEEIKLLLTKIS
jgi:phosphoglucomutase